MWSADSLYRNGYWNLVLGFCVHVHECIIPVVFDRGTIILFLVRAEERGVNSCSVSRALSPATSMWILFLPSLFPLQRGISLCCGHGGSSQNTSCCGYVNRTVFLFSSHTVYSADVKQIWSSEFTAVWLLQHFRANKSGGLYG